MISVYKRELKSFFTTYIGYIFTAFVLLTTGVYSWFINYLNQSPQFEYILFNLNFIYLIAVPILSMRVFAAERKQKTDILLSSLPLKTGAVVLGKYLAQLTVLLIPTAVICIYPLILMLFGMVSVLTCYSTVFGFFLMGAALIAIGTFISALTDNQIVAAISTFAVLFVCYLSSTVANGLPTTATASYLSLCFAVLIACFVIAYFTKNGSFAVIIGTVLLSGLTVIYVFKPTVFEGLIQRILNALSLFDRLSYFVTGVFDITSVVYYLSVAVLFCFLTVQLLNSRRWS